MELLVAVQPERVEDVNLVPPPGQHPIQPVQVGAVFLRLPRASLAPSSSTANSCPSSSRTRSSSLSSIVSAVVSPASAIMANRTFASISAHPTPSGSLEVNPPNPSHYNCHRSRRILRVTAAFPGERHDLRPQHHRQRDAHPQRDRGDPRALRRRRLRLRHPGQPGHRHLRHGEPTHPLRPGTARSRGLPPYQPQPAPGAQPKGAAGGPRPGLSPSAGGPCCWSSRPSWKRSPPASPPSRPSSWPTSCSPTTPPPASGCSPRSTAPTAPARCRPCCPPQVRLASAPLAPSPSRRRD